MSEAIKSTITTVLVTGLLALLGTVGGGVIKGFWDKQLADQKLNSNLVMKALESDSPSERLASLEFMVQTRLIKDREIEEAVLKYIEHKKAKPEDIPQIRSEAPKLSSPSIKNARVFLLSGTTEKTKLFKQYSYELERAGFQIVGSKDHKDPERPDIPEIRYFYQSDKTQAEHLAEYVGFKLQFPEIQANYYQDPRVRPGYLEIWFGR
jgi:hypothetical protein